jgi:DNA-binding LacI/PurR family transcriptional regulator
MLLGVIVGDITDPFFANVIEAISAAARQNAYNVVLGHAHGRVDDAVALKAVLETRHCDAIILLGDVPRESRLVSELVEVRLPSVSLGRGKGGAERITSVDVDNQHGIAAALEYLVSLGHERIAFIGARTYGDFPARRNAYLDFMKKRRFPVRPGYDQESTNDAPGGAAALDALLRLAVPPTAVIAATDRVAIGALHAAHRARVRVPEDISVVGFDDIPLAAFAVPALTTVRMPVGEMAQTAVREAIAQVGDVSTDREVKTFLFRPTLIVRDSCASPGRNGNNSGRSRVGRQLRAGSS